MSESTPSSSRSSSIAPDDLLIPTSIFTDRTLKVLETIVEYLKESKGLSYAQIATVLNRDDRTIWTVYHRAGIKRKPHLHPALPEKGMPDALFVPCTLFTDRNLKVLEVLVEYLKLQRNLTYHQIAILLNRDDRTIWTVFNRAQKKRSAQTGGAA